MCELILEFNPFHFNVKYYMLQSNSPFWNFSYLFSVVIDVQLMDSFKWLKCICILFVSTRTNLFIEYAVFSVVEPWHTITIYKAETLKGISCQNKVQFSLTGGVPILSFHFRSQRWGTYLHLLSPITLFSTLLSFYFIFLYLFLLLGLTFSICYFCGTTSEFIFYLSIMFLVLVSLYVFYYVSVDRNMRVSLK